MDRRRRNWRRGLCQAHRYARGDPQASGVNLDRESESREEELMHVDSGGVEANMTSEMFDEMSTRGVCQICMRVQNVVQSVCRGCTNFFHASLTHSYRCTHESVVYNVLLRGTICSRCRYLRCLYHGMGHSAFDYANMGRTPPNLDYLLFYAGTVSTAKQYLDIMRQRFLTLTTTVVDYMFNHTFFIMLWAFHVFEGHLVPLELRNDAINRVWNRLYIIIYFNVAKDLSFEEFLASCFIFTYNPAQLEDHRRFLETELIDLRSSYSNLDLNDDEAACLARLALTDVLMSEVCPANVLVPRAHRIFNEALRFCCQRDYVEPVRRFDYLVMFAEEVKEISRTLQGSKIIITQEFLRIRPNIPTDAGPSNAPIRS